MQKVLFGAGDFSPPMLIFSGLKSRAPTDMYPANCRFVGVGLNAADAQVYDKKSLFPTCITSFFLVLLRKTW